jgi:hypothetical protein
MSAQAPRARAPSQHRQPQSPHRWAPHRWPAHPPHPPPPPRGAGSRTARTRQPCGARARRSRPRRAGTAASRPRCPSRRSGAQIARTRAAIPAAPSRDHGTCAWRLSHVMTSRQSYAAHWSRRRTRCCPPDRARCSQPCQPPSAARGRPAECTDPATCVRWRAPQQRVPEAAHVRAHPRCCRPQQHHARHARLVKALCVRRDESNCTRAT